MVCAALGSERHAFFDTVSVRVSGPWILWLQFPLQCFLFCDICTACTAHTYAWCIRQREMNDETPSATQRPTPRYASQNDGRTGSVGVGITTDSSWEGSTSRERTLNRG
jgi:hypothetical protein